jgi:hypothetical protein
MAAKVCSETVSTVRVRRIKIFESERHSWLYIYLSNILQCDRYYLTSYIDAEASVRTGFAALNRQ